MQSFTSITGEKPRTVRIKPRAGAEETPEAQRLLQIIQAVDWASLYHAYGPASDVPGQLWAACGRR